MKATVLGCGASWGVPAIGPDWGRCDPTDPRNRRRRCSLLIEAQGRAILIDTSPDLREQLIDARISRLDAVLLTHAHADHLHGLDDLDLLKMDIEGSEWEVLLSTPPDVLARIRHIQLEYHEVNARFGYTPDMLFKHLAGAGHRLKSHHEDTYRTGLAYFERR